MKLRIPFLFGLLALLIGAACNKAPETTVIEPPMPLNKFDDPKIQKIYDLADRRMGDSLLPFLQDANPKYRLEAAKVMGSVQDSAAGPALAKLLENEDPKIVEAAAWALGQIGDSAAGKPLHDAFVRKDADAIVLAAIGEAIGKAGSSSIVSMTFAECRKAPEPRQDQGLMRMLYRAGMRKIIPFSAEVFAISRFREGQVSTTLHAAAYLGRVQELGPVSDAKTVIAELEGSINLEVRQQLVKSLRRCDKPECTEKLREIILNETEATAVRVGAIRAAGDVHPVAEELRKAVLSPDQQVAVTAAEFILDFVKQDYSVTMGLCRQVKSWRPRAILLHAAMKDAVGQNAKDGIALLTAYADSLYALGGPYEKGALLIALGSDAAQHDRLLATALTLEKVVSSYATEALTTYHDQFESRNYAPWIGQLQQLVRSGDPGLIAMAAEHIAAPDPARDLLRSQIKGAGFLDSALVKLRLPADIEAYNAVEKALAAIQKKEPKLTKLEHETAIDWALVKRIPTAQTAEIKTNKGMIVFTLKVEDAPGTVANFVKLVQQGFYDGKTFHRVVPAFVAQGGCPRGDGWGSTPETIRSEWPQLHYGRGQVGMASAGKDTESCQWFITHCEVPHLDGRYTIFATVTKGMEVVDQLEIGDVIEKISLPGIDD